MTRGEFDSRYQLLSCIADAEVRSYGARELATGREVMVHLLTGMSDQRSDELRRQLRQLDPRDGARVLEETDVDGEPLVLTEPLPEFTSLPDWVESRVAGTTKAPESSGAPGEFTMLFGGALAEAPRGPEPSRNLSPPPERAPPAVIRLGGPPSRQPTPSANPFFGASSLPPAPSWPAAGRPNAAGFHEPKVPVRGPADIAELIGRVGGPNPATVRDDDSFAPAAGQPAVEGSPARGSRSYMPLILILTFLFLSAVGLVLYFTLKSG
jgi:hypothetical protein